jgi:hypothetical protein
VSNNHGLFFAEGNHHASARGRSKPEHALHRDQTAIALLARWKLTGWKDE